MNLSACSRGEPVDLSITDCENQTLQPATQGRCWARSKHRTTHVES